MSNNLIPQLVCELNQIPPTESRLLALEATGLLKPVMTLAEILKYQEILTAAHENDSAELEETERVVQKCQELPAVPLEKHVPLGFYPKGHNNSRAAKGGIRTKASTKDPTIAEHYQIGRSGQSVRIG